MHGEGGQARGRVAIAIAAAVASIGIIIVVAVASGGPEERRASAPPDRCVKAWNADPAARAYGRHNFSFHLYQGALVTYLTPSAAQVGGGEGGLCAVVFPSRALDPEPFAAGQLLRGDRWLPLSSLPGVELGRVAELQVTAAEAPNTRLDDHGELSAL